MTNRPTSLDSFIGQHHLVENLKVILGGAQYRQEAAPHMLFMGPPGLGKTSLAQVIAAEMGTSMVPALATMLKREADIATLLMSLDEGDVLFIDEIHALPRRLAETLYSAVEDFYIDVLAGPRARPRPMRLRLPKFTLVGATTHPGGITGPLRDRFGFVDRLEFYSFLDLSTIIDRISDEEPMETTVEASYKLAKAGRGTPRVAIHLWERARDIAQSEGHPDIIDQPTAERAMVLAGVTPDGLNRTDISVLSELKAATAPVGLATLAASLGEEESTIESMVEPYLLRMRLIERLPNGRVITQKGLDLLHA